MVDIIISQAIFHMCPVVIILYSTCSIKIVKLVLIEILKMYVIFTHLKLRDTSSG